MKFQKLGLISAAAVLASMVSAGAYTHPAPVIPTPVGNLDGMAFYVGGALSSLGGSARNQSFTKGTANAATYTAGSGVSTITFASTAQSALTYSLTGTASDVTSTVNTLKFGGEGHLGAYVGVADGFGVSLEAFGVTRTSFNPVSTVLVADISSSTTLPTAPISTTAGSPGNVVVTGLNINPTSLGYGFRVQPTVMMSDVFGMYASVGYGSQKWEGTLINSEVFGITNTTNSTLASPLAPTALASGVTGVKGQAISKNLSGMNYGLGSVFNIDETISVYSAIEVQKFSTYSVNANGAVIASTSLPTTAALTTAATAVVAGTTSIADAGTVGTPSAITLQLNTYSVGVDYAFA